MPRCDGCGQSGFRLVIWRCLVCSKSGCHSCGNNWKFLYEDHRLDAAVCSQPCFMHWFWKVFPDYRAQVWAEFSWARGLDPGTINMLDMYLARTLEQEGNYGKAIAIYERYFLEQEVQRLRSYITQERDKLFERFRKENRWVNMDCPKCGALNKVGPETRMDVMASCYACGKMFDDFELVGMIQRALGLVQSPTQTGAPASPDPGGAGQ